jgi:glutathione S-transferase
MYLSAFLYGNAQSHLIYRTHHKNLIDQKMTIQIYCDPCTVNSRKVLAGLEQLKADYNQNFIDYSTGQHKSDEFKKINPHATVPAATDGDLILTESNAILQYAADITGAESMYPKDLKQRACINRWLFWEASVWFPTCYVFLVQFVVKPLFKTEPDQKAIEIESERFHKCASILNTQLGKTRWLTGDNVTIADFAVAAPMHVHAAQRLPLEEYPNLKRWMIQDIEQLESWKNTQGPVNKALLPNGLPKTE